MTAAHATSPIASGDLLANGRYRVEEVLGEGGMGVVCAATHVALGQRVAIKFLLPQALEHPQAVARFEREARASASMTSEYVVRVTDVGTLETGAPYFVMEFLEGEDLAQRIRRRGPLEIRAGLKLMAQACEGLIEAHSKGLVHRDIKPSNLFLAKRSSGKSVLKVIDFGIAKAELSQESGGHELTRTSEIMGSPKYMSPEQLRDTRSVDGRTDIWSLGAAFYECLTGRPPFAGETITELVVRIATEEPEDVRRLRSELPDPVVAILKKCLTKTLSDRYASAGELLEAIESCRGSLTLPAASATNRSTALSAEESGVYLGLGDASGPISATRIALPVSSTGTAIAKKKEEATQVPRRKPSPGVLVGVCTIVLAAVILTLLGRERRGVNATLPAPKEEVRSQQDGPTPNAEAQKPIERAPEPPRGVEPEASHDKARETVAPAASAPMKLLVKDAKTPMRDGSVKRPQVAGPSPPAEAPSAPSEAPKHKKRGSILNPEFDE